MRVIEPQKQKILMGVTGASGSIYADQLLEFFLQSIERIYLVATDSGKKVSAFELSSKSLLMRALTGKLSKEEKNKIRVFDESDLFAPCASGTSAPDAMVVVPCSMGTLSRIAHGHSSNLLERSADVMLKQRRKLLICPRESPLNLIHLRNMTSLVEAGAEMIPLMPGFYNRPKSIDDIVRFSTGKIAEQLHLEHDFYKPWNHRML